MNRVPTPHISAKAGEIAKTVIMPGDPLRAKFMAEKFLKKAECFNAVRGVFGYTGEYGGSEVTVMASGMGMPSMGIYSYELYNFYRTENIIRIGTAGAISRCVGIRDIVVAMAASTDSNYAVQYGLPGSFAPTASYSLFEICSEVAKNRNIRLRAGNVLSTDVFYSADETALRKWGELGVLAVEMETAALYMTAARAGKNAISILTVSDDVFDAVGSLSSEEREKSLTEMMELSLEMAVKLER